MLDWFNGDDLIAKNNQTADDYEASHGKFGRRGFLKSGLMAAAVMGFWTPDIAQAARGMTTAGREIKLTNAHTGEKFKGEYWFGGKYIPDAFGEIKSVMKDHRTGDKFPVDPRLMDILYVLQNKIGNFGAFEVLSGYRSPKTNNMLRHESEGVAKRSLHMTGQAVDIRLPGTTLANVKKSAIGLKAGGVGYYARSNFVHIDTGRVRTW